MTNFKAKYMKMMTLFDTFITNAEKVSSPLTPFMKAANEKTSIKSDANCLVIKIIIIII